MDSKQDRANYLIDQMKSGIWIDSLISHLIGEPPVGEKMAKPYSTDVAAAWDVVKWWIEEGEGDEYVTGDLFIEYWQDGEWFIFNTNMLNRKEGFNYVTARSDNVDNYKLPQFPLAICRFALKCGLKMGLVDAGTIILEVA